MGSFDTRNIILFFLTVQTFVVCKPIWAKSCAEELNITDVQILSRKSAEPLNVSEIADTGSRIQKTKITDEEAKEIRAANHLYYSSAKKFALEVGEGFSRMVLSRVNPDQETTIVIAMGGAEHLGTLIEAYIAKFAPKAKLKFRYIPMPTDLINPWKATRESGSKTEYATGIGEVPEGFKLTKGFHSSPEAFASYLSHFDLMNSEKILAIDTGLNGTQPESVAYALRMNGFKGEIEGILLSHLDSTVNRIPIYSLSEGKPGSYDRYLGWEFHDSIFEWAYVMDNNHISGGFNKTPNVFQRSSTYTVQIDSENNRSIDIKHNNSPVQIRNYKETVLGILDGVANLRSPDPEI